MLYIGCATVNNWKYLEKMIKSLKSKYSWKLLIVDNGSKEPTLEYLATLEHEVIYNPTNLGVSKAWNQVIHWGLSFEDMELVLVPNNDIVLHPDALDRLMESVLVNKKGGVSGLNIGNLPIMLDGFTRPTTEEHRYNPSMNFSLFGLTKPTITSVGLFDEGFKLAYWEDNDFHHRMKLAGIDASCDTWAAFTHYGSRSIKEGGVIHEPFFTQNRVYYIKKWGGLPGQEKIR